MRHAHKSLPILVDERKPAYAIFVAGIPGTHIVKVAAVDLIDDFKMARQQGAEEAQRPLLQSLRHQGVVGIGHGMRGYIPRRLPVQPVLVHQQAHQLRNRDSRVGVVQLNGEIAMQIGQGPVLSFLDAKDMLQRAGDEEELLDQPQLLAPNLFVVWVKDLGNVL